MANIPNYPTHDPADPDGTGANGADPYASDPYAADPYASGPHQAAPYSGDAYGTGPGGTREKPRNGLGVGALVLGIIGLALCWTVVGGVILGLLALILGIVAVRRVRKGRATNRVMPIFGIVLGALALVGAGVVVAVIVSLSHSHNFKQLEHCMLHAHSRAAQNTCEAHYRHGTGH